MTGLMGYWKTLRSRYWLAMGFDLLVLLCAMWAIHVWQSRDLPLGEATPATVLPSLADGISSRAVESGAAGVVYFFAPWCGICKHSIGNLDQHVEDGSIAWATAIALDFADENEVAEFVTATGIKMPVLLGTMETAADWGIQAFPTYFAIDENGNIDSRSVGYSTSLGIRLRAWLAR